jgi:hypothetical protein
MTHPAAGRRWRSLPVALPRPRTARYWILGAALVCVLAGCARPSRPTIPRPSTNPTAIASLQTIIAAIEQDPCSTGESDGGYAICAGRYLTQVDTVARSATAIAGGTAHPDDVRHAAQNLLTATGTFTHTGCGSSTGHHRCTATLDKIGADMNQLSTSLAGQAATSPAS